MHAFIGYAAKRGVKRSIVLSVPATVLFFLGLYNIEWLMPLLGDLWTVLALGTISILASMLYYMGFHIDFAKSHLADRSAKQFGSLQGATIILSVIGPLLGAFIIKWASFDVLFIFIIVLLVLGVVPLFFAGKIHEGFTLDIKDILSRKERQRNLPYIGEGVHFIAAGVFWPLMLYVLAINLQEIGGLYSFTNLILAGFTVYLGRVSTSKNQHSILRWGTIVHSASLTIRTTLKTVGLIAVVQGFGALSWGMVNIPFFAMHYNKSQKHGIAHTVYAREIYAHIGRFLAAMLLAVLLLIGVPSLPSMISIILASAVAVFLMTFIKEE